MENMAAGRFDVSWGRELCNYSKRDCYKNVACGLESSRFLCGSIDRKNGNCLSVDHRGIGKSSEIEKLGECGIELPPCKKRRISPIVLDRDDKGIGALFDNGLVRKNASVSKCVSLNQGKGVEVLLVDPMVRHGLLGSRLPVSQTNMCPSLPIEDYDDEQKEVLVEEEKCFQTQDNSMSRWASDSDSPRNVYLVNKDSFPAREEEVPNANSSKMSSLESGEFRREGSEEDKPRSLKIEEPGILAWGSINMLQACRSAFEYEKFNKINAGSYGIVYKAIDKKSGQHVALKKVKLEKEREGFPVTALREINILLSLNHPSIVNVKEVVMDDVDNVFIAMEYMEYDLQGLMETMTYLFSISEVKCLMLQLLEGVCYLHENWVLHRDLKTSNLLLNENGKLKICDFGLSRQYGCPLKPYTPLVVTLWYRAPELLLGRKQYSTAIDMWSVGCIMAELLTKKSLFQGESEIDQLNKIFRIMGTPNEMICPGFSKLQGPRAKFVQQHYNMLRKKFPGTSFVGPSALSDLGLDLLDKFLTYDPKKRITAEAALNHDWFREFPLPKYDFRPTFHGLRKSYL